MKSHLATLLASAMALAIACGTGTGTADAKTLRLGTTTAPNHPQTEAFADMAERAKAKTNGELDIQIFPAGQLGAAPAQMESVMTGSQDMFGGTAVFAGGYEDNWRILSVYFLFTSADHIAKFAKSDVFEEMNQKLIDATGVRALSLAAVRGPSTFISKEPIRTVEDMQGKKVRIPSVEGYARSLEALGAVPTPVAWTETYLAFSQGIIDVVQSSMSGIESERFTDSGKYILNTGHNWEPTGLFINEQVYESLSDEEKTALSEAVTEANAAAWVKAEKGEEELRKTLESRGAEIIDADPAPFRQKIIDNLGPKLEAEGFWNIPDLYQRIVALDSETN
ncbi:TRAP transporter substrate-binding protein [Afifella sp. IM 167]|uniref:TRAP transporter substrate-binding protein n=1 Tax=Afifella sp. IM 167 TaxID=2033586 RepID=UPI001CCAA767|nr:TRAP transporter substrate-binding protein [Afifella sp. IM 167]MBZ8135149.1 hypothetical protein [Afifella sp. IM 167]